MDSLRSAIPHKDVTVSVWYSVYRRRGPRPPEGVPGHMPVTGTSAKSHPTCRHQQYGNSQPACSVP